MAINVTAEETSPVDPKEIEFTDNELRDNVGKLNSEFDEVLNRFTFTPDEEEEKEELDGHDEKGEEYTRKFLRGGYRYRITRWTEGTTTTGYQVNVFRDSMQTYEEDIPRIDPDEQNSTEWNYRWFFSASADQKPTAEKQLLNALIGKTVNYSGIRADRITPIHTYVSGGPGSKGRWETDYAPGDSTSEDNPGAVVKIRTKLFDTLRKTATPKPATN